MSKVIKVEPRHFGNSVAQLDSGHSVSIPRGDKVPAVGDEYEENWHPTGAVKHALPSAVDLDVQAEEQKAAEDTAT